MLIEGVVGEQDDSVVVRDKAAPFNDISENSDQLFFGNPLAQVRMCYNTIHVQDLVLFEGSM